MLRQRFYTQHPQHRIFHRFRNRKQLCRAVCDYRCKFFRRDFQNRQFFDLESHFQSTSLKKEGMVCVSYGINLKKY